MRVYANGSSTPLKSLEYAYRDPGVINDEGMLRLSETQKTGTSTDKKTVYGYDNLNRLCWASTASGAGSKCSVLPTSAPGEMTYSYTWDQASNLQDPLHRRRRPARLELTGYGYDAANELCWSTSGSFTTHACAPPSGATSYAHDNAGNRTTGGYTYDAFNRLEGTSSNALTYADISNNELVGDGGTTLVNSPLGIMASTTSSATTRYVRMPGGELVGERTSSGTRYVVPDALGSTRWLLSGNTIDRGYDYTPDGETTATGSGADSIIRFAGGHLTNLGLYHFGARYYDPATARWTQADPLMQPADLTQANGYLYAAGCPTSFTDPSGLRIPVAVERAEKDCRRVGGLLGDGIGDLVHAWSEVARGKKARGGTSWNLLFEQAACHVRYDRFGNFVDAHYRPVDRHPSEPV